MRRGAWAANGRYATPIAAAMPGFFDEHARIFDETAIWDRRGARQARPRAAGTMLAVLAGRLVEQPRQHVRARRLAGKQQAVHHRRDHALDDAVRRQRRLAPRHGAGADGLDLLAGERRALAGILV